jgi:hypothetical protein
LLIARFATEHATAATEHATHKCPL